MAYIESGVLPPGKKQIRRIMVKAEDFIVIQGLLFKVIITPDKECELALCIPEDLTPYILQSYHENLTGSHMGITQTLHTIKQKYFMISWFDGLSHARLVR